jgi:hypothetical protein
MAGRAFYPRGVHAPPSAMEERAIRAARVRAAAACRTQEHCLIANAGACRVVTDRVRDR